MSLRADYISDRYSVITPSNTDTHNFKALYVGGAGDVNVEREDGNTCLFSAVPAGTILPISGARVLSTSTTATLIVALY